MLDLLFTHILHSAWYFVLVIHLNDIINIQEWIHEAGLKTHPFIRGSFCHGWPDTEYSKMRKVVHPTAGICSVTVRMGWGLWWELICLTYMNPTCTTSRCKYKSKSTTNCPICPICPRSWMEGQSMIGESSKSFKSSYLNTLWLWTLTWSLEPNRLGDFWYLSHLAYCIFAP